MRLDLGKNLTNQQISQIFLFISQVLDLDEKNAFRARAYQNAGVVISQYQDELAKIYLKYKKQKNLNNFQKYLDQIPGIGQSMAQKLLELFETGDIKAFQKYVKDIPQGVWPIANLHGIGVKRALELARKFKLNNKKTALKKLLNLAKNHKIQNLEHWGQKSEAELIKILTSKHAKSRLDYDQALKIAKQLKTDLLKSKQIIKLEFLGSLRRKTETIGDIDLGMAVKDINKFIKFLKSNYKVLISGPNMIRIILKNNLQVDIKISPLSEWGSFLQHFTGGKEHNIRLREYALKKNLSLSEHGIKNLKTKKIKKFHSEHEFYKFLSLKYIPPEERIGGDELERFAL